MEKWNAEQYLKFKKQRTQPAIDLAARAPLKQPEGTLDGGCGSGNCAAVLHERLSEVEIWGMDSSEKMVRAAKENHPGLCFVQGDAAETEKLGKTFELIFSNACLQWVRIIPGGWRDFLTVLGWAALWQCRFRSMRICPCTV